MRIQDVYKTSNSSEQIFVHASCFLKHLLHPQNKKKGSERSPIYDCRACVEYTDHDLW